MRGVGLANNGGSRTLVRCVETLRELGHKAFFHCGRSRYTWHPAKIECIGGETHPPCDVTIATGINSVRSVARYTSARLQTYYVRGLELWKATEATLLRSFRAVDRVFVNSQWLYAYMREYGISVMLQYPGLDPHWFHLVPRVRAGAGALRNNRHATKRNGDIDFLERQLDQPIQQLNRHIKRPTPERLNNWYNGLKVWFAPTELEGLHNPPIEAALAGCALVCTDHPRSGMQDYAIHEQTALVYPARDIDTAARYVSRLLRDESLRQRLNTNMVELLHAKFGTRAERMREFVTRLES
jgi:hypothetical protein